MSCLVHFNYELTNICSYIFIIIDETLFFSNLYFVPMRENLLFKHKQTIKVGFPFVPSYLITWWTCFL